MPNYVVEHGANGRNRYRFSFAGREIVLVDFPGTVLSVESLSNGSYEAPLPILLMASLARTEGAFCDVGANIGIYSVLATKTKPNVDVYAFEPLPAARQALTSNLEANGTLHQVDIRPIALSDVEGSAGLYLPDPGHGLLETSASLEASFKQAENSIEVPITRLDSLHLPREISVIKADIEGHEAAFLRGARRVMAEDRPLVYAEMLSGASKQFFEVSKMMRDLDYIPFRMRPDAIIYTKLIVADKGWNYAFIPAERIDLLRDCCRAHNIELLQSY